MSLWYVWWWKFILLLVYFVIESSVYNGLLIGKKKKSLQIIGLNDIFKSVWVWLLTSCLIKWRRTVWKKDRKLICNSWQTVYVGLIWRKQSYWTAAILVTSLINTWNGIFKKYCFDVRVSRNRSHFYMQIASEFQGGGKKKIWCSVSIFPFFFFRKR